MTIKLLKMLVRFVTKASILFISTLLTVKTMAQSKINPDSIRNKMQWFADAKLGIFIHYGVYAVNGIDESWSFHNRKITHADYMKQMKGFTASQFNPELWASLIKESGARYAVITTKHHDGVALWPTKEKHYSVVKNTPAKRDLIKPFYAALDRQGIKRGAYYSLIDWSYPDYPGFLKDSSRYKIADDPLRWKRFQKFNEAQINELNTAYKPDLWWFDGDWEHSGFPAYQKAK
jgi:alpha-L-fucosidase